ncbi:MAG: phytoene/squalene synthase family protein [Halofilum sp. (in: g-proteobacteria)]|nr:phytoene/squalene synthase family protein [Halofilum sp. (in: g-proteobacteria)]
MATSTVERVEDFPDHPEAFQQQILPLVSRTFALTIPQLPAELASVVANAYLLCRIADTIEDDPELSSESKSRAHERFLAALESGGEAAAFGPDVASALSERTLSAERRLVERVDRVVAVTHGLRPLQRDALVDCVRVMCRGMGAYQRNASLAGLADLEALDGYCYYVAGVVGEMLTELFLDHCHAVEPHRERLMALAPSFGEGLQLTNILKDLWDDRARGACWMPRDLFARHGIDVERLEAAQGTPAFGAALNELVALAHGHLRNALEYTLLIPRSEAGVRRFCLWAIGMAVLTLKRIHRNPAYGSGGEVKIPRSRVRMVVMATNAVARSDRLLRWLFAGLAAGLPLCPVPGAGRSPGTVDHETGEIP